MADLTKENLTKLLGSVEDFSADVIKEQLAIRNKAVAILLARFRKAQGIKAAVKVRAEPVR